MTRAVLGVVGACALALTALATSPASACPGGDAKKEKAPPSAVDSTGDAPSACPDGDNAKKTPAPPPPQG